MSTPAIFLINANGHRDRLDATTKFEFVFGKDEALEVSVDEDGLMVEASRKGVMKTAEEYGVLHVYVKP